MQTATPARDEACAFDGRIETWIEDECTASVLKDVRLKMRFFCAPRQYCSHHWR